MKKINALLSFLLAACLMMTFAACGNANETSSADGETESSVSEGQSTAASAEVVSGSVSSEAVQPVNVSDSLENVYAPVSGSTAVATTPMDQTTVRDPQTGSTLLHVNKLFCDKAVLQRGVKVPVWGTGENGRTVTVEFAGQKKTVDCQNL